MNLAFETRFLGSVVLLSLRLGAVFLLTPLFAVVQVPVRIRVLLVIGLAYVLVAALGVEAPNAEWTVGRLLELSLSELVIGGVLAFGVLAAFAAFHFGGRLLDFQIGFSVANLIDPVTQTATPLLGTVLNFMGVVSFYLLDGHHVLIRGIAFSLERFPLGTAMTELPIAAIIAQFGLMFTYGLALAAPVVLVLLLVDAGMALAARTMPQMNVFIVGIPLKIFVGLSVLAVSLNYMGALLGRIYGAIFHYWEAVLA